MVLRIRPLINIERDRRCRTILSRSSSRPNDVILQNTNANTTTKKVFSFTHVFDKDDTQEALFRQIGAPKVASCLEGTHFSYLTP